MAVIINGTSGITDVDGSAAAPAITGTDTDTGLFFSANTLGMATGGSERVTVDSSGNVGIGTSSPGYAKLSVWGGVGIKDDEYLWWNTASTDVPTEYITGSKASGYLKFGTSGSDRLYLNSSGNLGLGVTPGTWTSTIKALQIGPTSVFRAGDSAYTQATFVASNARQSSAIDYYIANGYATSYGQQAGAHFWNIAGSGSADAQISFTQAMTLNASGNLLVGLTSSDAKFHVTNGASPSSRLVVGGGGGAANTLYTVLSGGNNIQFETNGSERARIDSSGSFMVGTTSTAGFNDTKFWLSSDGTTKWSVGPRVALPSTFYVLGQAGSAGVYLPSTAATAWSSASDERLKTEIVPFENAAQKVCSLRAGTGRYLTDDETMSRSFLIAQDVQKVLPEAVNVQPDEQGTLGLAYTEVIPLLVAAIKELKADNDDLRARIAALESK